MFSPNANRPNVGTDEQITKYIAFLNAQLEKIKAAKFNDYCSFAKALPTYLEELHNYSIDKKIKSSFFNPKQEKIIEEADKKFTQEWNQEINKIKNKYKTDISAHRSAFINAYLKDRKKIYHSPEFLLATQPDLKYPNQKLNQTLLKQFNDLEIELNKLHTFSLTDDLPLSTLSDMQKKYAEISENFPGWNTHGLFVGLQAFSNHELFKKSPPSTEVTEPIYSQLELLRDQGLQKIRNNKNVNDQGYGQITRDLADELISKAHEFFDDETKIKDPVEQNKFQTEFTRLMNSQNDAIKTHRAQFGKFKKIMGNVAKGLGITCSLIGIPIYVGITKKNPMEFFTDFRTNREKTLDNVKERVGKIKFK